MTHFIHGELMEIDIGHGKKATIDAADYELIKGYNWNWQKPGAKHLKGTGYAQASVTVETGKYQLVLLHRLLTSAGKGDVVSFADHDGLNCRRSNLRLCTRLEANRNAMLRKDSSTGRRNVEFRDGAYRATVRIRGVRYRRSFSNLDDASQWVQSLREQLHGDFAYRASNDVRQTNKGDSC